MMKFRAITTAASAVAMAASMSVSAPAQAQASEPFIGQLMLFGGNFCPRGWSAAEGQLLPISQNDALFSLFGTIYGGDGRTTFALPDLRGRAPIGRGTGPGLAPQSNGQRGGSENFTLTEGQMPSHTHDGRIRAFPTAGNTTQPVRNYLAMAPAGTNVYAASDTLPTNFMGPSSVGIFATGGSQAVNKRSPYLAMQWCVSLFGVYPSRN